MGPNISNHLYLHELVFCCDLCQAYYMNITNPEYKHIKRFREKRKRFVQVFEYCKRCFETYFIQ